MADRDGGPGPKYLLLIRSSASPVPAPVRLRRLLKALLRAYGFRCLELRELPAGTVPSPATAQASAARHGE